MRRRRVFGRKGQTEPARKHRFETFSQRIAKLKINPVQPTGNYDLADGDERFIQSHFQTSLDEWKELNLSVNFVDFYREAKPLCESLPQLLHHQNRIFELLVKFIDRKDHLSLEPLLSLTSHLAHDLGARFEQYFAQIVSLISQLAATHPNVDVIEWSFNCLAWLFKYLSRLLVPDLRPLYDLFAPLLGKCPQKSFVVRFAAEALSFLVRRAAVVYKKDPGPLQTIIRHAFDDLRRCSDGGTQLYRDGLVMLFVGSMKGVGSRVHIAGQPVLKCLLRETFALLGDTREGDSLVGSGSLLDDVIVSLAQSTDVEGFEPILDVVLDSVNSLTVDSPTVHLEFGFHLLGIVMGVRGGSRVGDWRRLLSVTDELVSRVISIPGNVEESVVMELLKAVAICLQLAPQDVAIPYVSVIEKATWDRWEPYFIPFCILFADLGRERFLTFLSAQFNR